MKRIDKSERLAENYFRWLEDKENKNLPHGPYNSSSKYTKDIRKNLLWCQQGLCAYTETYLGNPEHVAPDQWKDGKHPHIGQRLSKGDIEHFDPSQKSEKAYLWDNLFLVNSEVNKEKGTKAVDVILKPDRDGYDPFSYLDYDMDEHMFFAHPSLSLIEKERVQSMIQVLQLNWTPIREERRKYLTEYIGRTEMEFPRTDAIPDPMKFPTALQMVQRQLSS